jgi:phospholipase/carboxylesterase
MNLNFTTQPPRSGQTPNRCLVVLHGWGANLYDLTMLASELNLPNYQFVFVEAPFPHPQVRGGRAWYALESPDRDGLETSRTLLRDFLNQLEAEC